ncbi:transposase DDE domain protein [Collimonas pratensis]|uniref:Transposase DDE domain protein n=1 Tax=Collimonas pratensis TaxID=279113 RepID=A0A127QAC7_9BURK|nr:transposase [Collimonas pratensis]AMP06974.1 transposase DDE domain protein [Collimonas pratensis]
MANSIWHASSSTVLLCELCSREKTGSSPLDRCKLGSKHHLIIEQKGIPLAIILINANTHDVTQALPLVETISAISSKRGRPLKKPKILQGDRSNDSEPLRRILCQQSTISELAKRRTAHGSGLGKTRRVVERSISWLHSFRRLKIRYEKLAVPHEAFLSLACSLICWNFLKALISQQHLSHRQGQIKVWGLWKEFDACKLV